MRRGWQSSSPSPPTSRNSLSARQPAQQGLSPAAARRCLLTLADLGYLYRDGNQFRPTPRMIRLGSVYFEVADPARPRPDPMVTAARDEISEAVSVAVLEGADSLIVARAEVHRIVNTGVRLGARLPAHASASGRILLAGLPDDDVDAVLEASNPVRTTPHTLVTTSEIRARIELARAEGVAVHGRGTRGRHAHRWRCPSSTRQDDSEQR